VPRLISVRPGSVTSCDLGVGHWRIGASALPVNGEAALGLVLHYTPAAPFTITPQGVPVSFNGYAFHLLAAAAIDIAENVDELKGVADKMLEQGAQEEDHARATEAMNLFKNKPRIREETFQGCLRDTLALIDGYWSLVAWITSDPRARSTLQIADAKLVLEP
jgi:hypothetical protein